MKRHRFDFLPIPAYVEKVSATGCLEWGPISGTALSKNDCRKFFTSERSTIDSSLVSEENHIFILSGGAGTRLWPLSRESFPKQFYDLAGTGKPLLIETVARLKNLGKIYVVTTEALKHSTLGLLNRYRFPEVEVIGEPEPKNTAAAVCLASIVAKRAGLKSMVGIFPADHFIKENEKFRSLVELAFTESKKFNDVVTIGVEPEYAATGYGYLKLDKSAMQVDGRSVPVREFVEKPQLEKAQKFLTEHSAVWNAGMFIFPATTMLGHFETLMPELWLKMSCLQTDLNKLNEVYPRVPAQSVDYGIMERLKDMRCVPGSEIGWSDVGSWEEVAKRGRSTSTPDEIAAQGNFYTGFGPHSKKAAFVGVSDLIVVDTPDVLLVLKKGEGQKVKDLVAQIKADAASADKLKNHVFEERPWGRFEVLTDNKHFKSKIITVWPGQRLSYQSHQKRSEHWIITSGKATVTLNDHIHHLTHGEYIYIPQGSKHRIANESSEVVEFIEVQSGSYFGEDDIKRFSDDYGRA